MSDIQEIMELELVRFEADVEAVVKAKGGGDFPPCVFNRPSECRYAGCGFTEQAWEDWIPPPAGELDGEALLLSHELFEVKRLIADVEGSISEQRARCRELQEQLVELGVEPGRDYSVGPYSLRRIEVSGKQTFSLSRAKKAGFDLPEQLIPFASIGAPSERWTVKRVSDDPVIGGDDDAPF